MMEFLKGKKSYLIAIAVAIVAGLHQLGYISDPMQITILTFLGAGAVASLKAAVTTAGK